MMHGIGIKCLEPLLFTVQEVPRAIMGFSPFELLYARKPHYVLDIIRENWEGALNSKSEIWYILNLTIGTINIREITTGSRMSIPAV